MIIEVVEDAKITWLSQRICDLILLYVNDVNMAKRRKIDGAVEGRRFYFRLPTTGAIGTFELTHELSRLSTKKYYEMLLSAYFAHGYSFRGLVNRPMFIRMKEWNYRFAALRDCLEVSVVSWRLEDMFDAILYGECELVRADD